MLETRDRCALVRSSTRDSLGPPLSRNIHRLEEHHGYEKDRYGLSWQVVPAKVIELLTDEKSEKSQRAFSAMMRMKKLDIAAMKKAYEG